jgi:hypothetical protein
MTRFPARLVCTALALGVTALGESGDVFSYPQSAAISRTTILGEGWLIHKEVFAPPADESTVFSYYDALLTASGWQPWEPFTGTGENCATCPDLPVPPFIRHYKRQRALFTVEIRRQHAATLAVRTIRLPSDAPPAFPALDNHQPLYPHGTTIRQTRSLREGLITHVYEFRCPDNPALFFDYLNRSLSRANWRANEHLALLSALTGQDTIALYQRGTRQLSIVAGEQDATGQWHYTIMLKETIRGYNQAG